MRNSLFGELTFQEVAMRLLILFLVTLFFFQGFRTYVVNLYVAVWNIVWIPDSPMYPLFTILVFAAPLLGIVVGKKVSTRTIVLSSAILTSICALLVSLELTYEFEFLMAALVVGFSSLFFPFYLSLKRRVRSTTGREVEARIFTVSFALALSYDVLVRTLGGTYDVSRTRDYFLVQLALTVLVIALVGRSYRLGELEEPTSSPAISRGESTSRLGGVLILSGVGALLFLELSLLANPHNVLRWALPSYNLTELTLLTPFSILMLTIAVLALLHPRLSLIVPVEKWNFLLVGNILLFAFILTSTPPRCVLLIPPWFSVVLSLIAQFFMVLNLHAFVRYAVHRKFQGAEKSVLAMAFFLGLLILLLWNFMFAFTYTHAYFGSIFEGQARLVLLSATVILGLTSIMAAIKVGW